MLVRMSTNQVPYQLEHRVGLARVGCSLEGVMCGRFTRAYEFESVYRVWCISKLVHARV